MKITKIITLSLLAGAFVFTSCKKDEVQPNSNTSTAENGEFKVRMTDAPGDYKELKIEITKVEAYHSSNGWITINNNAQVVSVLDLTNGTSVVLGSKTDISYGSYSKVRLTYGNNHSLKVNANATASGGTGTIGVGIGLAVNANFTGPQTQEFVINSQVNSSQGADILLDFDVAQSVQNTGGDDYEISPVVRVVEDMSTGAQGTVNGRSDVSARFTNSMRTYTTYTNDNGQFYFVGMADGTYTLTFNAADDNDPTTNENFSISGVVIASGEIKNMGTITF